MKNTFKILTTCLMIILSLNCFAQEKFTTYNDAAGRFYSIGISAENKNVFKLWIGNENFNAGGDAIVINQDQYQSFIDAVTTAKSTFANWLQLYKGTDLTKFSMPMHDIKFKANGYFMNAEYPTPITFEFEIREPGPTYSMIIWAGKIKRSSFWISFSSEKEIDAFLSKISLQKIQSFITRPR